MSTSSFGRYSVIRKIGSGGMAEVFLARSKGAQGTEKRLVIKKIHPALASNERFIGMFIDEARVAMRLNHSNIVQVYAFEQIDGDHILAMEHVDGCDLQEILLAARRAGKRLPFGLCAYIAAEIAKGLDYAHSRRDEHGEPLEIVHRDVSPQNVLVSRDGAVKIADFGIARARSIHAEALGVVKGKLGYMSPEQACGLPVNRASDIFSLGVVLHEMLTGAPLIAQAAGADPMPILREGAHRSPASLDPSIPAELDTVVRRAMAPDASARYPTAREMAQALLIYLHSERRIYDGHTLESWIERNLTGDVFGVDEQEPALSPTVDELPPQGEDETVPLRSLGEVEQRAVVLVSARLVLEPQPERAAVSAELERLAGEIAYKADGILSPAAGGLRVFLGIPHSSMEDAIRGIRLAHDLKDITESLSQDNRLRIDTGIAVTRGYVRYRRGAGNAAPSFEVEDELAMDSRRLLEAAGAGEIVAGGGVFRLARQEYSFESSGSVEASDVDESDQARQLKVYVVKGPRGRDERRIDARDLGEFHGREAELERLEVARRRAVERKATLVKVVGEIGIGKTHLVRRFFERAKVPPARIVTAECLFVERHTPFATVLAAVRSLLALAEDDRPEALDEALSPLLDGASSYLRRQIGFFRELLASPERVWTKAGPGQRDLIRRAAFGLGVLLARRAATAGPVVVVVENAQWMDGPSSDALSELASLESDARVFVLLVGQSGTLSDRRIAGLEELELEELPAGEMRAIVARRLGEGPEIDAIAEQIVERAQGNPFFAGEIIDSLIERGILERVERAQGQRGGPRFRQAKPGAIGLPTTMEGLAASHIDALDPAVRTTLRVASVIGASFTLETLASLVGRDVRGDLDTLLARGFLVPLGQADRGAVKYRFARPMVREAAYVGLSRQDRHRIHRILAEALIAARAQGEPVPPAHLAWHLEHGGEPERAGQHYLEGGDAALAVYSNRRALRLVDRAVALLPPGTEQRFDALRRREKILRDLGLREEREATIAEMAAIARQLADGPKMTLAANVSAQFLYDGGEYMQAAKALERAIALGAKYDDPFNKVESLRLMAYTSGQVGHLERALECCNWALGMIPPGQEGLYLRARVLGVKGAVHLEMGDLEGAPFFLAEALVIFRHLGKRRNESTAMSNIGLAAQARGDLMESLDFLERAILLDRKNKDISARGRKLAAIGSLWLEIGELEKGRSFLEEGLRICRDNLEPVGEVEAHLGLAELALARAEPMVARGILEEVSGRGFVARSRILLTRHRQLLSMALLGGGDSAGAREAADEATRIAKAAGMAGEVVHGAVRRGLALLATAGPAAAMAAVEQVDDLIEELKRLRRLEEVRWFQAMVLHGAGDAARAKRALDHARLEVDRKAGAISSGKHRAAYERHPLVRSIRAGFEAS